MQEKDLSAIKTYENVRTSFGPELCAILDQPGWSDVMVTSTSYETGTIKVDTDIKRDVKCTVNENGISSAARFLAAYSNNGFNDSDHQTLDAVIPIMNLRCSFVSPPASRHTFVTFRKPSQKLMTLDELLSCKTLTETQAEFLVNAMENHKNIIFAGGTGCHSKGTKILMANGKFKYVEDIQPGFMIMGDNGKPRMVLSLHRGKEEMYKITPTNGNPFYVNKNHILSLAKTYIDKNGEEREDIFDINLSAYLKTPEKFKKDYKLHYSKGIEQFATNEPLPIDPYVLGLLLSDRCHVSDDFIILDTDLNDNLHNTIRNWLNKNDFKKDRTRNHYNKENHTVEFQISEECNQLLFLLGLFTCKGDRKFIPSNYKVGSVAERKNILKGFLDASGSENTFITMSDQIVRDVEFIAKSLGLSISVNVITDKNTAETMNEVTIFKDKERLYSDFKVENIGVEEYFGFECDGNHRYLTSDFMVHHNSGKTSIMNTMLNLIDPSDRLYIIEDISEIICDDTLHPFNERVVVNRQYTYSDAIATALRQRPDRIIIGECRYGNQALEMLKAWGTGHPGGLSTIHANDAKNAIERLDQLCSEVSISSQKRMINDTIDIVVQMGRERNSTRRLITELYDVREDRNIK